MSQEICKICNGLEEEKNYLFLNLLGCKNRHDVARQQMHGQEWKLANIM
jgi:hypothetical protein